MTVSITCTTDMNLKRDENGKAGFTHSLAGRHLFNTHTHTQAHTGTHTQAHPLSYTQDTFKDDRLRLLHPHPRHGIVRLHLDKPQA